MTTGFAQARVLLRPSLEQGDQERGKKERKKIWTQPAG